MSAKSLEKHPIIIPGEYKGLWSAYFVKVIFANGKHSQEIELNEGVRGINCKCEVVVDEDGTVNVS